MPTWGLKSIALSVCLGTAVVGCTPAALTAISQLTGPPADPAKPALTQVLDDENPDSKTLTASQDLNNRPGLVRKRPGVLGKRIPLERAKRLAQTFFAGRQAQVDGWQGGAVANEAPTPFYDGVEAQPAAFEFAVQNAAGKPQGRIVVATSSYVTPVPEFAPEGMSHQEDLMARYRRRHGKAPQSPKYYRFSAFSYALEDAADPATRVLKSVGAFDFTKAKGGARRFGYYADDEATIAAAWAGLDRDTPAGGLSTKANGSGRIPGTVPRYFQQDIGDCVVGCVPIAWGMIYGYYEQRGTDTIPGSAASNLTQNASVEAMTRKIAGYCQTYCKNGAGSTKPTKAYLGRKWGRDDRSLTVRTNFVGPDSDSKLFEKIKAEIDEGRPVLLGFNDDLDPSDADLEGHAVTVWGYDEGSSRVIHINTGWASDPVEALVIGSGELNLSAVVKVTLKE